MNWNISHTAQWSWKPGPVRGEVYSERMLWERKFTTSDAISANVNLLLLFCVLSRRLLLKFTQNPSSRHFHISAFLSLSAVKAISTLHESKPLIWGEILVLKRDLKTVCYSKCRVDPLHRQVDVSLLRSTIYLTNSCWLYLTLISLQETSGRSLRAPYSYTYCNFTCAKPQ